MKQQERRIEGHEAGERDRAMMGRLLKEGAGLRRQILAWRGLAEGLEAENRILSQRLEAGEVPCSGIDLERARVARLEGELEEACDQNRRLRTARRQLEVVLDDRDDQIEALQRHVAALEASLARRRKTMMTAPIFSIDSLRERLTSRRLFEEFEEGEEGA